MTNHTFSKCTTEYSTLSSWILGNLIIKNMKLEFRFSFYKEQKSIRCIAGKQNAKLPLHHIIILSFHVCTMFTLTKKHLSLSISSFHAKHNLFYNTVSLNTSLRKQPTFCDTKLDSQQHEV